MKPLRLALATLASLTAALAVSATPALAARGHAFCKACTFGAPGSGNGQFSEPAGIAVNESRGGPQSGDVYVVDRGNNRVEWFSATGTFQGQFNGSGLFPNEVNGKGEPTKAPEPLSLTLGNSVAVDNACSLHNPVLTEATTPTCKEFDPSNGDVYVTSGAYGTMVVDKFSSTGAYIGQIKETTGASSFALVDGVAVDPSGRLWVAETHFHEGQEVHVIDSFTNAEANAFIPPFIGPFEQQGPALAVDSEDSLYVFDGGTNETIIISKLSSIGAVLNKELERESDVAHNGVASEFPSNDVYVDNLTTVRRFAPDGSEVEAFGEGHLANSCHSQECDGGVAVNSSTGQVYVSEAPSNVVQVYELEPPAAPSVVSESLSQVTDDSATFNAEINPRSLPTEPGKDYTHYRFKYGVCASTCAGSAYEASTPVASLAPSFNLESVSAHVEGLHADTTYHFILIAENAISESEGKPVEGQEGTFTTRATGEFVLPDGRQWEMVSPPQKGGASFEAIGAEGPIQAAAGGAAMTYPADAPSESEPQGTSLGAQVLSTRGSGGWASRDLTIPHSAPTGLKPGQGEEYRFFSEDLSLAIVQPFGSFLALSPDASEQTAYRNDLHGAGYTPLVTGCPAEGKPCEPSVKEHANVPEGTVFGVNDAGEGGGCPPGLICGPDFQDASPDLSHVVLRSKVALTETTPAASEGGLYEWSAGKAAGEQLQLLSRLPLNGEGKEPPAGGTTNLGLGSSSSTIDSRHAISNDGSRVFWSAEGHLYMRDTVDQKSLLIDAPEPGCPPADECGEGALDPEFQLASSDGSKVFFTDTQKLTADGAAYAQPRNSIHSAADLYVCEIEVLAGEPKCDLHDLAPKGAVLGSMLGSSEDGSWVYFLANGVLANSGVPVPGAVPGGCPNQKPSQGFSSHVCNLYVRHAGETKLVAVLSGADLPDWSVGLTGLTARAAPDGEWLAFSSQRSLTGYDNRDAVSGRPDEEVYLYHASTGALVCASCDPTGARPHGTEYPSMRLVGEFGTVWEPTDWLAANVPTWSPYTESSSLYQSRYLSNSGRLFFDSSDALVAKDANGTEDVYEYEPQGVPAGKHACSSASQSASDVFKPERSVKVEAGTAQEHVVREGAGCVALISSGSSAQESAFLDASETGGEGEHGEQLKEGGGDVFFLTTAKLAPQDFDHAYDVYDAQECTSAAPCPPPPAEAPPPCTTEASCRAAPSPQPEIFGPSGSATFSGLGNLSPLNTPAVRPLTRAQKLAKALKLCRKDKSAKKRASCERQARKRYGAAKAKKGGREGRVR